jgi:hypothetical protein
VVLLTLMLLASIGDHDLALFLPVHVLLKWVLVPVIVLHSAPHGACVCLNSCFSAVSFLSSSSSMSFICA